MDYLQQYYADGGKLLQKTVKRVCSKLRVSLNDDYYSLVNEVFLHVLEKFKEKPEEYSFDIYLRMCLANRIKSELTAQNRIKRKGNVNPVSWDTPLPDLDGVTLAEIIADEGSSVEEIVFKKRENQLSEKTKAYLDHLTKTERRIANYIMDGRSFTEIMELMDLPPKQFEEILKRMRSYEYTRILL